MVAAAFDSLSKEDTVAVENNSKPDELDERIINAKSVVALLSVADNNSSITRKHALKVGGGKLFLFDITNNQNVFNSICVPRLDCLDFGRMELHQSGAIERLRERCSVH